MYCEKTLRDKERIVLGYLDLDCLKNINDKYGHAAGDNYIRLFVHTIQKNFRNTDVFARVGGDEFCLILKTTEKEVVLETDQGMLTIKGQELHVKRLTLEKGEIDIEGKIDSLTYSDVKPSAKQNESLLGRLFK